MSVSYLLHNHVDYAVELGLAGIPLPETRTHPEIYFFDIVRQTNTIIFLVDKLFSGNCLRDGPEWMLIMVIFAWSLSGASL